MCMNQDALHVRESRLSNHLAHVTCVAYDISRAAHYGMVRATTAILFHKDYSACESTRIAASSFTKLAA